MATAPKSKGKALIVALVKPVAYLSMNYDEIFFTKMAALILTKKKIYLNLIIFQLVILIKKYAKFL
jgi:hypothetical protein